MQIILSDYDRYQAAIQKAVAQHQMSASVYAESYNDVELTVHGSDAIIPVCGPLSYRSDFWTWLFGGCSYESIGKQLEMAEADGNVKRIVYVFDTPGGQVTGIMEAADAIAKSKKPTVAVVDPLCASAGLWLASQCKRIVCVQSGEIGSLGVQCINSSYAKMLEEAGVDMKVFRADISPNKNLGMPCEPRSEEADAQVQAKVDRWGARFVAAVASGRGVSADEVLSKYGKGSMMEAADALEAGLIDEIGDLQSVLAESVPKNRVHKPYA